MKLDLIDDKYQNILQNIRTYFNASNNSIHLVIKSFKVPNIINKIIYTFFKSSKAKKSYDNSIKIIEFVPKPIGFIEFQELGLISDSYFISENFKYDFTIREPLVNENFKERTAIFKEFANFTLKLHEKGIFHLDYSPGNILIKKEGDNYIFKIVDINRMQFIDMTISQRLKNFSKLWAKDSDLSIIVQEYAQLMNIDSDTSVQTALRYSQTHKNRKNAKKRLKGKKVVD